MNVYILIPVESDNGYDAKIVPIAQMKTWAIVEFVDGKSKSVVFHTDRTASGIEWIDFVVLDNKFENYMDFMNEGMMCLVKRKEETIEDVISAFAFKELDEIGL
jgi:predicted Fe-Mo cluster-binding NifX family protein